MLITMSFSVENNIILIYLFYRSKIFHTRQMMHSHVIYFERIIKWYDNNTIYGRPKVFFYL